MLQNKKNSLWLSIQFVSSLIFSLITLKLNLVLFGEEIFGIWILIISFWGISTVIDLGFGTAIIKYIAGANESNNQKEINEISSTGFFIFLLLGIILLVLGFTIALLIYNANTSIIPAGKILLFQSVFILLGVAFYFQYLVVFYRSLFEGFNNFVITSKLTLIYNILILLSVFFVYAIKLEIWVLALFYAVSSFILFISYLITSIRKYPLVKIKPNLFKVKRVKKMFGFSFSVQIANLLGSLIDPVIKYIIGNFGSISIISYYEVARRFAFAIAGLFNTAFKTILPQTSVLKTKENYKNYILTEGIKYPKFGIIYSGISFGIGSIFIIVLIHFWFGFEQSIIIFFLLSLAESVNNTGYMVYTLFMGIGKGLYLIIIQLSNNILVIIFLILGFYLFHNQLGLIGYFISAVIMNTLMLMLLNKETDIDIKLYLKKININKLLMLLSFLLLIIFLNYTYTINIYLLTSIVSCLCIVIFRNDIKFFFFQLKDFIYLLKK